MLVSLAFECEEALDLIDDEVAVARFVERRSRAPAHQDELFAVLNACCELFCSDSHRAARGEILLIFDVVQADYLGSPNIVTMVLEHIGIA